VATQAFFQRPVEKLLDKSKILKIYIFFISRNDGTFKVNQTKNISAFMGVNKTYIMELHRLSRIRCKFQSDKIPTVVVADRTLFRNLCGFDDVAAV